MRAILFACALLLGLTACSTAPTPAPLAASARGSISGFATLATFGTWEMQLAPAYTRLASIRHRAAAKLDARQITAATALAVQAQADQARAALDRSRRTDAGEPTPDQRAALAEALRFIDETQSLLEQSHVTR
jgi:hypothetical protein